MGKTVQIDDDVMRAAEKIAAERGITSGEAVSELARQSLARQIDIAALPVRDGIPYLPKRGGVVTPELVERLADEEP
jgi:antitoxin component of RelBE/YafQ-DinJ toxin-antitoxin module